MQPDPNANLDVLLAVRELLSDEQRLETKYYASNAAGRAVNPDDPSAVRWCLVGALIKCGIQSGLASAHRRLADIAAKRGDYLVGVNFKGHAAVLALLDKGIAEERQHAA